MFDRTRRHRVSAMNRTGERLGVFLLVFAALMATGSPAFALKIPIQAYLTGAGEVPANNSPAKGVMTGTFDTDTNTLEWTVTYSGLSGGADRRAFPWADLLSRADAGGKRSDPGRNARQSRKPIPRRGQDRRQPGQGPQGRTLVLQRSLDKDSGRRNPRSCRPAMKPAAQGGGAGQAALALQKQRRSGPRAG